MDVSKKCSFADWKIKTIDKNNLKNLDSDESSKEVLRMLARKELDDLIRSKGEVEPDRGDLGDTTIEWRTKKPNYNLANLAFMMGKCKTHAKSSLEMIVQNAVKTWEINGSIA